MNAFLRSWAGRSLALFVALLIPGLGCQTAPSLTPSHGAPQFQRGGLVPVPGGLVNAAGGNLLIERTDLSIDTLFGTHEIRATWNALSGEWLWSFQMAFDGATFVDPSGAVHDLGALAPGERVPGSVWVAAGASAVETRGGLVHHFDAAGRLVHVAWRNAGYPRIEYRWEAPGLRIASCTQPAACLAFAEVALDAAGRPLSIVDLRTGRRAELVWDALGRLVQARSPQDVAEGRPGFRYEYPTGGTLLTALTNAEDERVEYTWQAYRRIHEVTQIGDGSPTHRFRFFAVDDEGLYETVHQNPLGARTSYRFDAERRLRRLELVGAAEIRRYEWSGLRVSESVLPSGATTRLFWQDDALVSAVLPSGNAVSFSYEPGGLGFEEPLALPVRRIEDSLGLVEERSYDAEGRLLSVRNGAGEEVALTWLTGSVPASLTAPDGVSHGFPLYGAHGHWLVRSGGQPDERVIDAVGNAIVPESLARGGGILTRGYDADRRLASLEVAATEEGRVVGQGEVAIARRSDGRPLSLTRPGGGDHLFEYDALGRLVARRERVDGVWQTTSFEYDAAGQRTARTRPNGMREEWERDGYGRVTRHRALRDGVLEGEALFTWADGDVVAVFDSLRGTTEVRAYDATGRLGTVLFGYGESLELDWDARSRLVREEFSLPGQGVLRTLDYAYDLANRRTLVASDGGEPVLEHGYADGRRTSTRYGNGLVRELDYDPESGLLVGATTRDDVGAVVEATSLVRSLEVAPARSQLAIATQTPLASSYEEYWIGLGTSPADPDQRVGKRVFGWRDGAGETRSFAYDLLGNRTGDFGYNAEGNRLLFGAGLSYTWDAAGFATSRGGLPIEWTATGRLASYGPLEVEWDLSGQPISITLDGVQRDFSLFGGRVDRDPQTGALGRLDLGEAVLGFDGSRRYRHLDGRGNVSFVSDEAGLVVSHYAYAPYGLAAMHGPEDGGVGFVGRQRLGELMLLGARMYDPAVGRFLSPDPVFRLVNAYAYAGGNPVWFSDPDGTHEGSTALEVGLAAGGLVAAGLLVFTLGPTAGAALILAVVIGLTIAAINFANVFAAYINGKAVAGAVDPASAVGGSLARAPSPYGRLIGPAAVVSEVAVSAPVGCSPTRIGALPDLGGMLYLLLPLQLAAAVTLLRRRRDAESRRAWRTS